MSTFKIVMSLYTEEENGFLALFVAEMCRYVQADDFEGAARLAEELASNSSSIYKIKAIILV